MAAVPIQFNGLAFPPFPSFEKGTCPTLLDAAEAQKVKAFIENFLTRTNGRLVTGSPPGNRFSMTMTPGGNFLELWVQTDLKFDPAPLLSANMNTGGNVIFAPQRDLFLAFLPQDLPLPRSLQAPGVGLHAGYFLRFSFPERPHDL